MGITRSSTLTMCVVGSLSFVGLAPVAAQTLTGRVVDQTNTGIAGAIVTLLQLDGRELERTTTTTDGSYQLTLPAPGRYRVRARAIGYSPGTSPPLDLVDRDSFEVDFRLAPVVTLPPVEVIGDAPNPFLVRQGYYERRRTYKGWGHFLEGAALRATALSVADLLQDVPGIRVSGAGGRRVEVSGRWTGRRRRPCKFYLNGVGTDINDAVSPSDIVAIEVYPGQVAPLEYGGTGCAVAAWTGIRAEH